MLQTRYCPLQMGRAFLTPGWLALALVLSGCGTPEAPGAPGTRPRSARGDAKAAGKLPGLDATSQSKSQAKVVSRTRSNRDAVGTRVEVDTGEPVIYRQRKGGVSMESANDPRLSIGVGAVRVLKKNKIRWPSGIVTTREDLKVDQEYKIVESKDGAAGPAHPAPAAPPGGPGVLSQ